MCHYAAGAGPGTPYLFKHLSTSINEVSGDVHGTGEEATGLGS